MTTATAADLRMSEAGLFESVRKLADLYGWRLYHTWLSRGSGAGFPDVVLCKPPRLVIAELKRETGKLRPAQAEWLRLLFACPGVETYLVRPSDLERVRVILAGEATA